MSKLALAGCVALSSAFALLACGDKGGKDGGSASASAAPKDGGKVASCNQQSIGSCREYRGANLLAGTDNLKTLCDPKFVSGAEFKEVPCPTEKVLASCETKTHKDYHYESPLTNLESSEKFCKDISQGTWTKK